jgi:plasmid stability protein
MPDLPIKNVPDDVAERLHKRAERNHRSLEEEALAIIAAAVREEQPATLREVLDEVRRLGLETPSEALAIIRADRGPLTPA